GLHAGGRRSLRTGTWHRGGIAGLDDGGWTRFPDRPLLRSPAPRSANPALSALRRHRPRRLRGRLENCRPVASVAGGAVHAAKLSVRPDGDSLLALPVDELASDAAGHVFVHLPRPHRLRRRRGG